MTRVRICIVGGGSYTWTPTILQDLALTPGLAGTIVLHDLNPAAAATMATLGHRIVELAGADFAIEVESDQEAALRDADFVIVTITTGGLEAMGHDIEIPARYGVVQSVGDTVGPGGVARALRNIPVLLDLARTMERVCPDAWLLNLTNPLTTLTRAITKHTGIKTIGLCHEVYGVRRNLMSLFDATPEEVEFQVAGINHLPWILAVTVRGEDALPRVQTELLANAPLPIEPGQDPARASFANRWGVKRALFERYGVLAGAGDRHLAEFFPDFLDDPERWGVIPTTMVHRRQGVERAKARVASWLAGDAPIPMQRSDEEVSHIIAAIAHGGPPVTVVNLPNSGQIDNLPRGAVVETMGVVGGTGATPLAVGALPAPILGTLTPHVENQERLVEAALTGDRSLALEALANDPLVRDPTLAPRMLDGMLAANAAYLPRFTG
jgi:alpha-galactosidase/6-phospho-beta-glucosidase family protein